MLTAAEFIRAGLRDLHRRLDQAVADLTPDQLHAVPGGHPRANTIAFEVWHYARTEDNVVRYVIQGRRPTVWMEGKYAERLGLPPVAQGTGMSAAEAQALRLADPDLFKGYMQQVWASTEELLGGPHAETLEKTVMVRPLGEMRAIEALGQVCLTHGMSHLGEIELIRTLVGAGPVATG
ncbi:MAG: DinB family protein [Candidatus Rokubacteria bacterium]|nr:DinB family protein [Candidatus Rokubacteria bacterium]